MKLALFGLLSLFGSAAAIRIHGTSHRQNTESREVYFIFIKDKAINKFDKNGDLLE